MANNWYTRLLKNIIGRSSNDVSSKSELRIKRLEDRRLLNADFAFVAADLGAMTGASLDLTAFDGADLQISEVTVNIPGPGGPELAYRFELTSGVWSGAGNIGGVLFGNGTNTLLVAANEFDTEFGGAITINDTAEMSDVNITFGDGLIDNIGGTVIDFVSDDGDGGTTTDVLNVSILNAGNILHADSVGVAVDGTTSFDTVGTVTLNDANNDFQSTVTIADAASVNLNSMDDLIIGGVTTDDGAITITTNDLDVDPAVHGANISINGLVSSIGAMADGSDGAITITADGTLTLDLDGVNGTGGTATAVNSGEGVTTLTSNGTMSQDTDGVIIADNLAIIQDDADFNGDIFLDAENDVDVFAARNDFSGGLGGTTFFRSISDLSLGTVNGVVGLTTLNSGVDLESDMTLTIDVTQLNDVVNGELYFTGEDNVDISADLTTNDHLEITVSSPFTLDVGLTAASINFFVSGGGLTLNDFITAGAIDLSVDGAISQNAAGIITATTLNAEQVNTTANTAIDLDAANNNVGTFTANNNAEGGAIDFLHGAPSQLIVGAVNANDGAITITTNDQDGDAAMHLANIRVDGDITSDGTDGGGEITLDADGSVTTNTGSVDADTADVNLTADTTITLNDAVTGNNVNLESEGAITQGAGGIITAAGTLDADQNGTAANTVIDLNDANNSVGTFTADNDAAGGAITFNNDAALIVGAVTSDNGDITITTDNGVASHDAHIDVNGLISSIGAAAGAGDGAIMLDADGDITLDLDGTDASGADADVINAGTGAVTLTADGDVSQDLDGTVTAASLDVVQQDADGDITLDESNTVDTFSASNADENGTITFVNDAALNVGPVTTDDGDINVSTTAGSLTVTGAIDSGAADTDLTAAAALAVNNTIDADDVALSAAGAITQNASGVITANSLDADQNSLTANTAIDLNDANNSVGTFTADNDADGGAITFNNDAALIVGTVTSNNGDITITTDDGAASHDAHIDVNGLISSIGAAAGAGDGAIMLDADGDITLDLDGTDASGADADVINAGTGTVTLTADGDVTQDADGTITAASLNVVQQDTDGDIDLDESNTVATFTASNADNGGAITFNNDISLIVGTVTSTNGPISITTNDGNADPDMHLANIDVNGLVSSGVGAGDIMLDADGDITLDLDGTDASGADADVINAGTGAVTLTADGDVTQDADGAITAASLNVVQQDVDGDITLDESNTVGTFTASNADDGGVITFNNDISLIVGNVSSNNGAITITTDDGDADPTMHLANINVNGLISSIGADGVGDGVTDMDADILLSADGTLTLDLDGTFDMTVAGTVINSGVATTRLVANGSITQDMDGRITANALGVRQEDNGAGANINLCEINTVSTFAANNESSDGFISFQTMSNLEIGSVGMSGAFAMDTDGVTTQGGFIELQTGGSLTLTEDVNANGGSVTYILGTTFDEGSASNVQLGTGGTANLTIVVTNAGYNVDTELSGNIVRIQAAGNITQDEIISANELGVRQSLATANNDIILDELNVVDEFAAENLSLGGQIEFLNMSDLVIGGVVEGSGKGGVFTATNGVTTTAFGGQAANLTDTSDRGDILIETGGSLTLAVDGLENDMALVMAGMPAMPVTTAVSAAGGLSDVRLIADGAINQDLDGLIVADELGVRLVDGTGNVTNEGITLGEANTVNEIAIENQSIGGAVTFQSVNNLTVGVVTDQNASTTNIPFSAVTGITTTSADADMPTPTDTDTSNDVFVQAGGFLFLDEAIDTNNRDMTGLDADVRLVASGDIFQDEEGLITANELGVRQLRTGSPTGFEITETGNNANQLDILLCEANNVDVFAADNDFDGGIVSFRSTRDLEIGTVTTMTIQGAVFEQTPAGANDVVGVTANDGLIELQSDMTLTQTDPINANGGAVTLVGGDVVLTATLATGAGDITIIDGGALTLDQDLTTTGSVRLQSAGAVTQTAGSIITAGELGVRQTAAGANIDINLSDDNSVDQFAASNASEGGQIEFLTLNDLTIGNVTAGTGKGAGFTAVNGVSTTAFTGQPTDIATTLIDTDDRGDILIETRGSLTLAVDELVDAMTGLAGQVNAISAAGGLSDARLIADGAINQDIDGLIIADELGVRLQSDVDTAADEDVTLGFENDVNEVSILNTSLGGSVTFQSVNNLTVGAVTEQDTTNPNIDFTDTAGVSTTSSMANTTNDILIEAGGYLNLDEAVTTDASMVMFNADVRLIANGDIAQDEQGVITANELGVLQREATAPVVSDPADRDGDSEHDVDLGFDNSIDQVAISNVEANAEINIRSLRNLTVGNVTAQVVQGANFEQTPGSGDAVIGITSNDGDILIHNDGALTIDANEMFNGAGTTTAIDAGTADVRISANGDIRQDTDGLIRANELGVIQRESVAPGVGDPADIDGDMAHDIDLGENNAIDQLAAINNEDESMVTVRSSRNLLVGTVTTKTVDNAVFEATSGSADNVVGVTATNGDITLDTAGALTIDANETFDGMGTTVAVDAGTGDVRLLATGDIRQDADGRIIANELGVLQREATAPGGADTADVNADMAHDVDLGFNNEIDVVAINNAETGSEINIHSTQNLIVGSVDAKEIQSIDFESPTTVDGALMGVVSADGDIFIQADMSLSLDLNETFDATGSGVAVDSGSANTRLVAFGDIRQDSDGLITANVLGVRQNQATFSAMADLDPDGMGANGSHDIDLGYVNTVNTFAATNLFGNATDGGTITFQNGTDLIVGTLGMRIGDGAGSSVFDETIGVSSTYTGTAFASRDLDGDGTFESKADTSGVLTPGDDNLVGDILIDANGSLMINSVITAGSSSGNSDVRLAADGAITQLAIITANELNVRQDLATTDTHITLTSMNEVDEFAAYNESMEGDISFTDADNLNVNALVSQAIPHGNVDGTYATFAANGTQRLATGDVAIANVAVGTNGGDITITAANNLSVVGVTASTRSIFSANAATDNGIEGAPSALGEDITLSTNTGDITLGQNVIVTTDEDFTANTSSLNTEDDILIQASSDNSGTFIVGTGVQVRTDGGVALDFTPRPTFPLTEGDFAFFSTNNLDGTSNAIRQTADSGDAFGNPALPATFYAYEVTVGVTGEENLEVVNDFRDPSAPNADSFAALGLSAAEILEIQSRVSNSATIGSEPGLESFTVSAGGTNETFGHVYSSTDVNTLINSGDARLIVPFSVSHHNSIQIQGAEVIQNGTDTVEGNVVTSTDRGAALFNLIRVAIPPMIEPDPQPEPNPAPPNPEPIIPDLPLVAINNEPPVASRVGVSSQSFDYFQLRRNEGEAGYVIIDEQISEDNGESLLDPRNLRQYVDDNNIPDEQDYELWLITTKVNNAGQSVTLERPILKFDVSGGRPIPAIEDLPMEFPELRLEPVPLDGDAEAEPAETSDMSDPDSESDSQDMPEKMEEEDSVSMLDESEQIQRIDGSHQASAIGVGSVLAVSNMNRKKASMEGRRVRNTSLLSRIFGKN